LSIKYLADDFKFSGICSLIVRSNPDGESGQRPAITAETIVTGLKKADIYRFSPANARIGVWTTFDRFWTGMYGSFLEDELFIFSPKGELASALLKIGTLSDKPRNKFAAEVELEVLDEYGKKLGTTVLSLASIYRRPLSNIDKVKYEGAGTIKIRPVGAAQGKIEEAVYIPYLRRHIFDDAGKIKEKQVESGYLFSQKPEK